MGQLYPLAKSFHLPTAHFTSYIIKDKYSPPAAAAARQSCLGYPSRILKQCEMETFFNVTLI